MTVQWMLKRSVQTLSATPLVHWRKENTGAQHGRVMSGDLRVFLLFIHLFIPVSCSTYQHSVVALTFQEHNANNLRTESLVFGTSQDRVSYPADNQEASFLIISTL